MYYRIEYHCDGLLRKVYYVGAIERGLVGDYVKGIPYGPNNEQVVAGLPFNKRKAAIRALWWTGSMHNSNASDVQHMHLTRKRDAAPMGTVYAILNGV